jgi:hypothetical protein
MMQIPQHVRKDWAQFRKLTDEETRNFSIQKPLTVPTLQRGNLFFQPFVLYFISSLYARLKFNVPVSISANGSAIRQPTNISCPEIQKVVRKSPTKLTATPLTENTSINSTLNASVNTDKISRLKEKLAAKYEKYVNCIEVFNVGGCRSIDVNTTITVVGG